MCSLSIQLEDKTEIVQIFHINGGIGLIFLRQANIFIATIFSVNF